jgi:tautomerase-like protein
MTNRESIEIHPIEGRHSLAQKSEFMRKATEAVVKVLGCSPEEVVVRIRVQARECEQSRDPVYRGRLKLAHSHR